MAWIELHQEFANHPKVAALSKVIKEPLIAVRGILVTLWCHCAAYAKDGDITRYVEQLHLILGLPERPGYSILKALVACGWVDEKNGRYIVHDWHEHGLKYLNRQKERTKKYRKIAGSDIKQWGTIRSEVLIRDNAACRYCGKPATTVDHVVPVSRGGETDPSNLVACCKPCNAKKRNKLPEEAGMQIITSVSRDGVVVVTPTVPNLTIPYLTNLTNLPSDHERVRRMVSEEFVATWGDWEKQRRLMRKPLTPITIGRQLKFLAKGEDDPVAVVEQSLAAGWQGLFPLKKQGAKPKHQFNPDKYRAPSNG